MHVGELITRVKIWFQQIFTGKQSRPKIPRKKLQIQFSHAKEQFRNQVKLLESLLKNKNISSSTGKLGFQLLKEVKRFEELNLVTINETRLNQIAEPLVHPADFSMWVLYQMYSYTEEIYHFIKTVEVVNT